MEEDKKHNNCFDPYPVPPYIFKNSGENNSLSPEERKEMFFKKFDEDKDFRNELAMYLAINKMIENGLEIYF